MRIATLLIVVAALLIGASPAEASAVTAVTVQNGLPSPAAGARTQYAIGFTATTALPQPGKINLSFPSGTDLSSINGSAVLDTTTGQQVGSCLSPSGLTLQCGLFSGQSIPAGDGVRVTLNGVVNPSTPGSYVVDVSTTADTQAVSSSLYSVAADQPVTNVSVDNTAASRAAGARTQYAVSFTTSSTGGLAQVGNSRITVTFPSGTSFSALNGTAVFDVTAGQQVGSCLSPSGLSIDCTLFSGASVPAGHDVRVTFNGVINPSPAGSYQASVSTTSDLATVSSASFGVLSAQPVTNVAVDDTAASAAAGGRTQYAVTFTASVTGGLAQVGNSRITVTFPSGTSFSALNGTAVFDTTAGHQVGSCLSPSGLSIDCTLFSGASVPAGHNVRVTFNGVINPSPAGSYQASVSTTSDLAIVSSASFGVLSAQPVTNVSVDDTAASPAAGARTQYAVSFTTSSTGGLAQVGNSRLTVTFPSGTSFSALNGTAVFDVTAGQQVGSCLSPSGLSIDCTLFSGASVPAGHNVRVTFNGVINPSPVGSYQASVSTTSDPAIVSSSAFGVVAANPVTNLAVALGSSAQSAKTSYTVTFDTSSTGGLAQAANSQIALTFPSGTDLTGITASSVVDAEAGQQVGSCLSPAGLTVDCVLFSGVTIAASRTVRVTIAGVGNPATPATYTLNAATTSDPVASAGYAVGTDTTPPVASLTSGPSGATTDATPSFAFSSNESGSTFECSVDGQAFAPCTSPFTTPTLAPGPHTFDVVAIDPSGNRGTAVRRSFTVAAATPSPTPMPSPAPTPTATPTPTPTPTFHKTVVVSPVRGKVLVRRPGSKRFVALDATAGVPLGSTLDTRTGAVQLAATPKPGAPPQTALFYDGIFKVGQSGSVTELTLTQQLVPCGGKAAAAARRARTRRLWGSGKGSFRTRGRYSAATVRGTKWLVQDSCAGTLTRVASGIVSVRDNVRRKTVMVRAGHSYLARPRR